MIFFDPIAERGVLPLGTEELDPGGWAVLQTAMPGGPAWVEASYLGSSDGFFGPSDSVTLPSDEPGKVR